MKISGPLLIVPEFHSDERGSFRETYKRSVFDKYGISDQFVQENISISAKGVLRGLHYQLNPKAQGKLVSVLRGRIFDVAVDIRRGSPTYGTYCSVTLSEKDGNLFWVPKGFAHGFLSMEDGTTVVYKTTEEYSHEHERGILWKDPVIDVEWPFFNVITNKRDSEFPLLDHAEINFTFGGK
jgi:dTDP-4-dehydrorhamnose 3,5-epimerase